jgi:mannose-6-phosphate isomerase-like protein (cupin superfamily)
MKRLLGFVAILFVVGVITRAATTPGVFFCPHDKVAASLEKSGPLVTAPDFLVQGSHRTANGQPELHDKETDIFYITDGSATFITGGKLTGDKVTKPGQRLGGTIAGGEAHQLTKGDIITIPAGTPHWFKEVPKSVSYLVVKVLKP